MTRSRCVLRFIAGKYESEEFPLGDTPGQKKPKTMTKGQLKSNFALWEVLVTTDHHQNVAYVCYELDNCDSRLGRGAGDEAPRAQAPLIR